MLGCVCVCVCVQVCVCVRVQMCVHACVCTTYAIKLGLYNGYHPCVDLTRRHVTHYLRTVTKPLEHENVLAGHEIELRAVGSRGSPEMHTTDDLLVYNCLGIQPSEAALQPTYNTGHLRHHKVDHMLLNAIQHRGNLVPRLLLLLGMSLGARLAHKCSHSRVLLVHAAAAEGLVRVCVGVATLLPVPALLAAPLVERPFTPSLALLHHGRLLLVTSTWTCQCGGGKGTNSTAGLQHFRSHKLLTL